MDFGEVLGTSWKIAWKHKTLWLFALVGMLAAFIFLPITFILNPAFAPLVFPDLAEAARQPWFSFLPLAAEILLLLVVYPVNAWVMTATDLGALRADGGAEKLSFRLISKDSLRFFRRVLGIMVLYFVATMLVVGALMGVVILLTLATMGLAVLCMIPLMLVLMPVMYLAQALMELAVVAIVADDLRAFAALKRAWTLLTTRFWPVILMTVILYFGLGFVAGLLAAPFILSLMFLPLTSLGGEASIAPILAGACSLAYLPAYLALSSLAVTLMRSGWTITYLRLTRPPAAQPAPVENA